MESKMQIEGVEERTMKKSRSTVSAAVCCTGYWRRVSPWAAFPWVLAPWAVLLWVLALCAALFSLHAQGHGDVTPQAVNTDGLDKIDGWVEENPYRGNELAVEIGTSAYAQNCARCHGLEAISGGITPDLRALNDDFEWSSTAESDEWYIRRVRHGATIQGRVYMPPFEGILSQEAMWAIRAYLDTRHLEE